MSFRREDSSSSPRTPSQRPWLFRPNALVDFELDAKNPEIESLERWRNASLVLNGVRRFRYTADIESKKKVSGLKKFRIGILAAEAARRFRLGIKDLGESKTFALTPRLLNDLVEDAQFEILKTLDGPEGVAQFLHSDPSDGIATTEEDISLRQNVYGKNSFEEKPPKSYLDFVFDAMQDITLIILFVCALVSVAVGIPVDGWEEGWYDGAGIAFSIFLVVFVTATSDYQQSLQFRQLDAEKKKIFIQVIRGGKREKVLVYDLVVGDVVFLSIGDIIPGDGLFLSGHGLTIDESSMTGESVPCHKNKESPFLLAGTKVQDGSATMLITGVGMNTQWGKLMLTLSEAGDEETPLQVKLSGVATLVGQLGLYVACLVFVILIIRLGVSTPIYEWGTDQLLDIVEYFAIAVTIIVVAVPEGLPLAVTLTLAYAMKRMMNDKALVRKLAACETMGSATTICSDKTGTLTANKMVVTRAWLSGSFIDPEAENPVIPENIKQILLEAIFQNTEGHVEEVREENEIKLKILGSPTESAILGLGLNIGASFHLSHTKHQILTTLPFNSSRKSMASVVRSPDGTIRVHWKGASEVILDKCVNTLGTNGEVFSINRPEFDQIIQDYAGSALRTLSLAYRDLDPSELPEGDEWPDTFPIPEDNLTLLSIVGIKDPLRDGVTRSVELCKSAGIKVRMVTGDNVLTAKAIAQECGILNEGDLVIEGSKFRRLSVEEMREIIPKLAVMARSSPLDKHILVKELRAMGEVVAVTGDGTNDAPALKEADIGLAMGIAGTEVAKDSADVIVLDDNFATIVTVAKWGRSVYNNIQKFVQFQLTVNIVALVINFVSACITGSAPLTAVQLLWVNLIMDTLGALALATEPPDDSLMRNPPVGRKGRFISNVMWRNIFGQAIYQLIVLFVIQYTGVSLFNLQGDDVELLLNTMIFNSFVFCQIFNEINSRHMTKLNVFKGIFQSTVFLAVVFATIAFQIILVQYLGKFASTTPLDLRQWEICVLIGFLGMPIAALIKLIPVSDEPLLDKLFGKSGSVQNPNDYVPLPGDEGTP